MTELIPEGGLQKVHIVNQSAFTSVDQLCIEDEKTYYNLTTRTVVEETPSCSTSSEKALNNTDIEIEVQESSITEPETKPDSSRSSESDPYGTDSESDYVPEPEIPHANSESVIKKSKKRRRNSNEWKKNKAKKLRNLGKSYTNSKNKIVPEKKIKNSCKNSCRQKCSQKFSENQRINIFSEYWCLGSVDRQRDYIARFVDFIDKARIRLRRKFNNKNMTKTGPGTSAEVNTSPFSSEDESETAPSRRKKTFFYHLPSEGGKREKVCQTFFLNTLGISHQIVKTVAKKTTLPAQTVQEDQRGLTHYSRVSEKTKQLIKDHISSFEKVESHYCRKQSSKEYLSPNLNLSKMYVLYLKHCENRKEIPAQKSTYRQVFLNDFNLGFHFPKKDQCDLCTNYKHSNIEEKTTMQERIDNHLLNKEKMRDLKNSEKLRADTDNSFCVSVFDLQQILPCPKTEVGQAYYKSKLATYNLTVFDAGKKQGYCFMWHEGIASRGCNEIGSCLLQFLKIKSEEGITEISFYSDNCTGQNRNKYIFLMFMYASAKYKIKITHNFFEVGHTQNEGDSMHSVIERASKHIPVYTPSQWYLLARTACKKKPYYVKEMHLNDFFDLKALLEDTSKNFERDLNGTLVRISDVSSVKADFNDPYILKIRYKLKEQYIGLNIVERCRKPLQSFDTYELKIVRDRLIPLSQQKYKSLLYFCQNNAIPKEYQDFFLTLPHE